MRRRALAAVAISCVLLAGCSGDSGSKSKDAAAAAKKSTYYFPTFLPAGFHVQKGAVQQAGPAHRAFGVALGREVASGTYEGVIIVTAIEAAADRPVAPNEQNSFVDVNGVRARVRDDSTGASVDWFAGGVAVAVGGPPASAPTLVEVADRLRGKKVSEMDLASLPFGYSKIADRHTVGHTPEAGRAILVAGPPPANIAITTSATNIPLIFAVAGGDRVETRKVRGHDALVSTRSRQVQGAPVNQTYMAWYEQPGALVSIIASTTAEQLLPVADGLATIDEATWRQLVPLQ